MKRSTIYEVALTGEGQNFYTLYRHSWTDDFATPPVICFIQNLSIDFEEAVAKARAICGPDEDTEAWFKQLCTNESDINEIKRLGCGKAAAELEGVLTFGKHKHEKLEEVFISDRKYVEWIAKGGNVKDETNSYWHTTIEEDRPVRQQAIALLIGDGSWIERNGKFMAVERAAKLDWFDSLTINPEVVDGKRIKGMKVNILKVYFNDNDWGGKWSFKFVDENNHIYNGSSGSGVINRKHEDSWVMIDFTPAIFNGKVYAKRIAVKAEASDVIEGAIQIENQLLSKKEHTPNKWTSADESLMAKVSAALNIREQIRLQNQIN
jgi:hypothetical protein